MKIDLNKEELKKIFENQLMFLNLKVYEINLNYEFENDVFQVLLEKENNKVINFDDLTQANNIISSYLDKENLIDKKYVLEVSSAGIERQIKSEEDLRSSLNRYIFLKTKDNREISGTLKKIEKNNFIIFYFIKGQPKKIILKWEDIIFVRYAIKF